MRQPDESFHHGIRRNSEGIGTYGPCSKKYLKNSMGLRDEKIRSVSWVANHSRILSFGDSFTEGGPIQWKKTFIGRISGALKSQGVEVLNDGVASYCPTTGRVKIRKLLVT